MVAEVLAEHLLEAGHEGAVGDDRVGERVALPDDVAVDLALEGRQTGGGHGGEVGAELLDDGLVEVVVGGQHERRDDVDVADRDPAGARHIARALTLDDVVALDEVSHQARHHRDLLHRLGQRVLGGMVHVVRCVIGDLDGRVDGVRGELDVAGERGHFTIFPLIGTGAPSEC